MDVRVRFAPSPTGSLHIGGARTALFNWLFARQNQGKLILRLEDTDAGRSTEDSARGIVEGLRWLGLNWDEGPEVGGEYGPYYQSQRLTTYNIYLKKLLESGQAYYCFCSAEKLQKEKEEAQRQKATYKYSGHCRVLSRGDVEARLAAGEKPVIRLSVPSDGITVVEDLVRGRVEFANNLFDDFIIAKSDGWPTYNFAVVVDDYTMKISHVIRAEEHLSNTPKQMFIYRALGWQAPSFAHVSMILSPDRSKLSKRHGATSVQEFRDQGYLPETLANYLALLGWSTGQDRDFWNLPDMIKEFSLKDISRSPAVYDVEKLTWMNGHYISECPTPRLGDTLTGEAEAKGWPVGSNKDYFFKAIELVKTRAKTTVEILALIEYFYEEPINYDEKGLNKYFHKDNAPVLLQAAEELVEELNIFCAETLEDAIRSKAASMGVKAGDLIHPIRLAVSGRTNTPGLFEIMAVLGREVCLRRIRAALAFVDAIKSN
ncbi:MAG: glutamate--tRNA ligase [Syntrophomonadaceae bacterium]